MRHLSNPSFPGSSCAVTRKGLLARCKHEATLPLHVPTMELDLRGSDTRVGANDDAGSAVRRRSSPAARAYSQQVALAIAKRG